MSLPEMRLFPAASRAARQKRQGPPAQTGGPWNRQTENPDYAFAVRVGLYPEKP